MNMLHKTNQPWRWAFAVMLIPGLTVNPTWAASLDSASIAKTHCLPNFFTAEAIIPPVLAMAGHSLDVPDTIKRMKMPPHFFNYIPAVNQIVSLLPDHSKFL